MTEREVLELLKHLFAQAYWQTSFDAKADESMLMLKELVQKELGALDELEIQ